MLERLRLWWVRVTCPHTYRIGRFTIVEEIGYAWEQCGLCGKEFWPDD